MVIDDVLDVVFQIVAMVVVIEIVSSKGEGRLR